MMRSRGRRAGSLGAGLAALVATGGLIAAILAKEGPPGTPAQTPLLRMAGALGMYDTAESRARCFSNVESITNAIQLYLTDYDRLPPKEHSTGAQDYFGSRRSAPKSRQPGTMNCVEHANPYLRWPVVLDDYLPTREVWSCPSARMKSDTHWIVPGPDWLAYQMKNEDRWGQVLSGNTGPCMGAYPPGWGGTITDSIAQGRLALAGTSGDGTGAFSQSIGYSFVPEMHTSEAADPTWFAICGDSRDEWLSSPTALAYPDVCRLAGSGGTEGCEADWENCPWTRDCGLSLAEQARFRDDAETRRRWARHQGGSTIGFLDGHVAWMASDDIIANAPYCECCSEETGNSAFTMHSEGRRLKGLCMSLGKPTGVQ